MELNGDKIEAYKVVSILADEGTFTSCIVSGRKYALPYAIDKPTLRREGHLGICCFDNIENTRVFMTQQSSHWSKGVRVLLVEGTGLRRHKYLCQNTFLLNKFYRLKRRKRSIRYLSIIPPKGTIFFDCVTPIREIDLEEEKGGRNEVHT